MKDRTKKFISNFSRAGLFSLGVLSLSSCHLAASSRPSTIVIAVDQFGVNQINCNDIEDEDFNQTHSGIALLCHESIRFTHAYTTSLQSGSALTSVLTGQYPFQHGLRSSTKSFLSAKTKTLAEIAQQEEVATAFFSGGAPILRKLNVQQGFEIFEDHLNPSLNRLHRPFLKLQKLFENWRNENRGRGFLAFFYVPDLALTWTPTQSDRGEIRNLSYESQVEEFDENLWQLIQSLKQKNIWDSTQIILVGLNGPNSQQRIDELFTTNLYSERTQVGLLIKPSRKPRDEVSNWSFDENISLADLGRTLLEQYGESIKFDANWPVVSLATALKSPTELAVADRPLWIESAWSEMPAIRTSVRWGPYLFLLDERPRIFNSLTDKLEITPLRTGDPGIRQRWERLQELQQTYQISLWPEPKTEMRIKWQSFTDIWTHSAKAAIDEKAVSFERLAHRLYDDPEIKLLYTRELLRKQAWEELDRWAEGLKLPDLEKVAHKNLKKENRHTFQDPCLAAIEIQQPQMSDLKKCVDPLALPLLEWVLAERSDSSDAGVKDALRKKFLRLYVLSAVDQKIVQTNWALQGPWDLANSLRQASLSADMMLSLPELQKYKQQAQKAVQQSQEDISEL